MVGPELSGEKVSLRPLCDADLSRRAEWLNDTETVRLFTGSVSADGEVRVYDYADADRWRQGLEADLEALVWAVEAKHGRHIGDVDLHSIDRYESSAKLTILLGDKAFWNRGYGTDTIRTVLRYAFSGLGLECVALRVYGFNKRAIHCYEKCGFIEVIPASGFPEPDEVHMIATKDRFLSRHPDAYSVQA